MPGSGSLRAARRSTGGVRTLFTPFLQTHSNPILFSSQWYKELQRAHRKSRKPRLRNALFRCFLGPTVVNGIISVIYIVIKYNNLIYKFSFSRF